MIDEVMDHAHRQRGEESSFDEDEFRLSKSPLPPFLKGKRKFLIQRLECDSFSEAEHIFSIDKEKVSRISSCCLDIEYSIKAMIARKGIEKHCCRYERIEYNSL